MLLDFAAEQPNREFLLQKHFTALLSSVWKVTSRVGPNLPSSRNGLYFGGRFLTSVRQLSKNSREPLERLKFTNLGQSSKMLAAALHDAYYRQLDDKVSLHNHGDDTMAATEQLELTIEFLKEMGDSTVDFPSVISLAISGEDAPPSVSEITGDDHHLKAFRNMAENRSR